MSEKGGRMRLLHIGLASPVMAMEGFLEKHRTWIEAVVGCATAETITLECNFPFSHLVLEQMLAEVNLDRQCLGSAETLRPLVRHWETPPECSPRIELVASRDRRALVTERRLACGTRTGRRRQLPYGCTAPSTRSLRSTYLTCLISRRAL